MKQSLDFSKPRLFYIKKIPYFYDIQPIIHLQTLHFRDYNPKQTLLCPQRIDEDIAGNAPVRLVDSVIDHLKLDNFKKLYKERGRPPTIPR